MGKKCVFPCYPEIALYRLMLNEPLPIAMYKNRNVGHFCISIVMYNTVTLGRVFDWWGEGRSREIGGGSYGSPVYRSLSFLTTWQYLI